MNIIKLLFYLSFSSLLDSLSFMLMNWTPQKRGVTKIFVSLKFQFSWILNKLEKTLFIKNYIYDKFLTLFTYIRGGMLFVTESYLLAIIFKMFSTYKIFRYDKNMICHVEAYCIFLPSCHLFSRPLIRKISERGMGDDINIMSHELNLWIRWGMETGVVELCHVSVV